MRVQTLTSINTMKSVQIATLFALISAAFAFQTQVPKGE